MTPEQLAEAFHEAYERLAPQFGYETRKASAKPWADVPEQNKRLMIAVCSELLDRHALTRKVTMSDEFTWKDVSIATGQAPERQLDKCFSTFETDTKNAGNTRSNEHDLNRVGED